MSVDSEYGKMMRLVRDCDFCFASVLSQALLTGLLRWKGHLEGWRVASGQEPASNWDLSPRAYEKPGLTKTTELSWKWILPQLNLDMTAAPGNALWL